MENDSSNDIRNGLYDRVFEELYPGDLKFQQRRYLAIAEEFCGMFSVGEEKLRFFSSPGRAEIGGNHTDHQRGRVLAATVQLDMAAAVTPTYDGVIKVYSKEYGLVEVDTAQTKRDEKEEGTSQGLIRGICAKLKKLGYRIGGFQAYIDSTVPEGSGISSSAAFENLITTILNVLYNFGDISPVVTAQIGQYAENRYFGKPSGLMDQLAAASGGLSAIDFTNEETPGVEKIDLNLKENNFTLCIVNTGGDHVDLTDEYAAITYENKEVANYFGKDVLSEVTEEEFYAELAPMGRIFGERALLRGMHFFDENKRVAKQVAALKKLDFEHFVKLFIESGQSSMTRLQNIYSPRNPRKQPMTLALEYSRKLLEPIGGGWRVHGGGFAGTIIAIVPDRFVKTYQREMDKAFGEGATHTLSIRQFGCLEVKYR